jgi:hypothetical protein
MPNGITRKVVSLVRLGIVLMPVLRVHSALSGSDWTVYLFSLCVVSLLSSRFTAGALVWSSNFPKYLVFHFSISLSTVCILEIFMDPVVVYVPRCVQNESESLGLNALVDFDVGIIDCPP